MYHVLYLLLLLPSTGALCYCELGTLVPKSGGEYAYLKEAFGPLGVFGELPAFLFAWTYTLIIKPSIVSIISLIFGTYVVESFFGDCADDFAPIPIKLFAALSISKYTILLLLRNWDTERGGRMAWERREQIICPNS